MSKLSVEREPLKSLQNFQGITSRRLRCRELYEIGIALANWLRTLTWLPCMLEVLLREAGGGKPVRSAWKRGLSQADGTASRTRSDLPAPIRGNLL